MVISEYLNSFYIVIVFLCIDLTKVTSNEKYFNGSSDSNNSITNANQIKLEIVGVYFMVIFCSVIMISVLLVFILILMFTISKRNFKKKLEETIKTLNSSSDKHWVFSQDQLKLGKILSSDDYCVVYQACAFGIVDKNVSTTVAVKAFKHITNTDLRLTKALISELRTICEVGSHLNIVDFFGMYYRRKTVDLLVIADYFPLGSVHQYILNRRDGFVDQITRFDSVDFDNGAAAANLKAEDQIYKNVPYPWMDSDSNYFAEELEPMWPKDVCRGDEIEKPLCTYDLLCWAYQVAKGMEFLASKNVHHGNLTAKNILLADRRIVKISDYGLAQVFYNNTDRILVDFKWMAVELINNYHETRRFDVSLSTDVWAFGVVLWELFSLADSPYKDHLTIDLLKRFLESWRMKRPEFADAKIYNVMLDCWKSDPGQRPTFAKLTKRLGDFVHNVTKKGYDDLIDIYVRLNSKTVNNVNAAAPNILDCPIGYENYRDPRRDNVNTAVHINDDLN